MHKNKSVREHWKNIVKIVVKKVPKIVVKTKL